VCLIVSTTTVLTGKVSFHFPFFNHTRGHLAAFSLSPSQSYSKKGPSIGKRNQHFASTRNLINLLEKGGANYQLLLKRMRKVFKYKDKNSTTAPRTMGYFQLILKPSMVSPVILLHKPNNLDRDQTNQPPESSYALFQFHPTKTFN